MEAPNWLDRLRDWLGAQVADLRYNWKPKVKRFRIHMLAFALFLLGVLQAADPYLIASLLPDRFQSVVYFGFGWLLWLLRKVTSKPVLVTTTYHGEVATTEPTEAPVAPKPDVARD